MGIKLLPGLNTKKLKLMGWHEWVAKIGKIFCKLLWQKEVVVIDREEGIFLFQVCLCPLKAFNQ